MSSVDFRVVSAEPTPRAVLPEITLKLVADNRDRAARVRTILLACQVRVDPAERAYSDAEGLRLADLFGGPERWGATVKSMLWANATLVVPAFAEVAEFDLALPCPLDLNAPASKYLYALESGEVPLTLFFRGTIFFEAEGGTVRAAPVSWSQETKYGLPIAVWKALLELHYPERSFLSLRRDVLDALYRFKIARGLPTMEDAIEALLAAPPREVRS